AASIDQCVVINNRAPRVAQLKNAGVRLMPFALGLPSAYLQRWWLKRLIVYVKPKVIHCWMRDAIRLVSPGKIPIVGWQAGSDKLNNYNCCSHFVSANRDDAIRMAKENPKIHSRFIPAFSEMPKTAPVDRNTLATPRDAKVLVSFSPLHPTSRPE